MKRRMNRNETRRNRRARGYSRAPMTGTLSPDEAELYFHLVDYKPVEYHETYYPSQDQISDSASREHWEAVEASKALILVVSLIKSTPECIGSAQELLDFLNKNPGSPNMLDWQDPAWLVDLLSTHAFNLLFEHNLQLRCLSEECIHMVRNDTGWRQHLDSKPGNIVSLVPQCK